MRGAARLTLMSLSYCLLLAFILDLLLGDPPWLPHPVRAIALVAAGGERLWRRLIPGTRSAGVMTVISVLLVTGGVSVGLLRLAALAHPLAPDLISVYLLYSALAARDLARHSRRVYQALAAGDLGLARRRVAMIVGRETEGLDEAGVCRATVESVAENLVDGVAAPLFWAMLGGPVAALLYKAVNTMDSLFGYKNERYREFGWAPARLDDLANYLPARIAALLVVVAAGLLGYSPGAALRVWRRDRRHHASPNSGQSEAAVAGALGIQLGGPARYFGRLVDKPCLGDPRTPISRRHILAANRLMFASSALLLAMGLLGRRLAGF